LAQFKNEKKNNILFWETIFVLGFIYLSIGHYIASVTVPYF